VSWVERVKVRNLDRTLPPLNLEEGEHIIYIVKEPDAPISTRFGQRLVYRVKRKGDAEVKTLFVPYRDETSESSALGQLKMLTEKYGSLKGRTLKVVVAGKGRAKRYSFTVVEQAELEAQSPRSAEDHLLSVLEPGASLSFEEVKELAKGFMEEEVKAALEELEAKKRVQRVSTKVGERFIFLG